MLSPYIAAIQIGQLQIQSEYARPVTAIVETAPEIHSPIFDIKEIEQITQPVSSIEPLQAPQIEQLAQVPPPEPKVAQRAPIAGNGYVKGYCTWYAKSKRPDLPNNLGDARLWYSRAQAQGIPVGSAPKVGAIGVSFEGYYGHVVYITGISGGNVTLSEMNWKGLGVVSTRTAPATSFKYIY